MDITMSKYLMSLANIGTTLTERSGKDLPTLASYDNTLNILKLSNRPAEQHSRSHT